MVKENGLENEFFIDSAGTDSYHIGEPADSRMRKHAARRGYKLTSRARRLNRADYKKFDYLIAMDYSNYQDILRLDRGGGCREKVHMMNDFSTAHKGTDVPDPWYGGADGFEEVLDMLEDSCRGFLEELKGEHGL